MKSALSDTIGQKVVFQVILFAQLLATCYYTIIVQFELSPWLWPYGTILWTLGGRVTQTVDFCRSRSDPKSFIRTSVNSVVNSTVNSRSVGDPSRRWICICISSCIFGCNCEKHCRNNRTMDCDIVNGTYV